jgi:hypothetical protein
VKKSEIPKRAGTTDKSISTGIKYWVCCIKESLVCKTPIKVDRNKNVTLNNVLKVVMNKRKPEQISSGSFNYLLNLGRVMSEGSRNNVSINRN